MQTPAVEEKKSFLWIYVGVAVFYAIMIVVYGVVVHNATEDGANVVAPIDSSNATPEASAFKPLAALQALFFAEPIMASQ